MRIFHRREVAMSQADVARLSEGRSVGTRASFALLRWAVGWYPLTAPSFTALVLGCLLPSPWSWIVCALCVVVAVVLVRTRWEHARMLRALRFFIEGIEGTPSAPGLAASWGLVDHATREPLRVVSLEPGEGRFSLTLRLPPGLPIDAIDASVLARDLGGEVGDLTPGDAPGEAVLTVVGQDLTADVFEAPLSPGAPASEATPSPVEYEAAPWWEDSGERG